MQQEFLDALCELGGSAGNGRLREALGWDEATYERARVALIEAGQIKPGRGRGGSVALEEATPAPEGAPSEKAKRRQRE